MSLSWIKLYANLPEHPKSDALETLLDAPRAWTHLIELWLWASKVRPDGNLEGIADAVIAKRAGWSGPAPAFVEALRVSGWLDLDGRLHDWDEHQGAHRDKAERDAERKREMRRTKKDTGADGARTARAVEAAGARSARVEERRGEEKREDEIEKRESTSAAPPPAPAPVVSVEPEPVDELRLATLRQAERRESDHVARRATRSTIAASAARSSAVFGRPQSVSELLALRVVELGDGRLSMAPEGSSTGTPLRQVWGDRYRTLDGKGEPKRPTIAEVLERVWHEYSLDKAWRVDGDGVGVGYLAWWSGILAKDAGAVRFAWEKDGKGEAGDPERGAAKRRYHELQGLGRDLPPFETWLIDFKRGATEQASPSAPPGSGARPSGPRSGAAPVHAADVMRATHDAMNELNADAGAAGLAAMKARTAKPRAPVADDVDIGSEVQS